MNTNVPQNTEDQEIDLVQISKKIGRFFDNINASIFRAIQFFIKNAIILFILILLGFGIGMYLDINKKTYNHQLIVKPNFGSVDYLYSKIDLIQSRIQSKDFSFFEEQEKLKNSGLEKITVEPIVDVFKFVNNNEQNLEVLKLITNNGDLKSIVKESTTNKNYPFYIIRLTTTTELKDQKIIESILKFLNTSDFYEEIKVSKINNIKQKIKENQKMVLQIDGIIDNFSNSKNQKVKSNLVFYNEDLQLNEIIKTKETLLKEIGNLNIELISDNKIVKESSITTNIIYNNNFEGKFKIVVPLLFLVLFILGISVKRFYIKQKELLR
ncbi:hypothetical protein SLW70_03740 [Flavobacterium sp. NG2]|uniref:hypothetical protein n=1 Tax=Flavobacterium sp. NG2 TaxID=3097547 RepID=UPI002A8363DB|nr:hypothetical protein [Flavobacterium sp. NG2]WPR72263.1 hypothetical protein SLW70_03740 [Flavobacterium sp. NG2]